MNLGDSNLRYVNTSKPQLVHIASKQSVTASDDYYSLTSEDSSGEFDRRHGLRYETPPMRMRSSRDALQSEATIPPLRPVKHTQRTDDDIKLEKPMPSIPPVGHKIQRKPVSSSSSSDGTIVRRPISEAISPPTPGVDDTPYIQFAIDQLTRDEEVSAARRNVSENSYPPDGVVLKQACDAYPSKIRRIPSDPEENFTKSPLTGDTVLIPACADSKLSNLHHTSRSLRGLYIGALILSCILMAIALIFCAVWPSKQVGLLGYDGAGTSRYFLFQYLPQLLAGIIVTWLLIIQCAVQRMYPFAALASGDDAENSGILYDAQLIRSRFLTPDVCFFRHGELSLGLSSIIFWLNLFTVPLQSCLFQTRYYPAENVWRWTTTIGIAWTLAVLYLLLALALVLVRFRFSHYQTGLRWDPTSLADIMVIFHRSNILCDFDRTEIEYPVSRLPKSLRLGYWRTSTLATETFYCVGDENGPVRRFSLERGGKLKPVHEAAIEDLESQQPVKASTFDSLQSDIHIPAIRYSWTPWFLRDTFIVAWIVIAVVMTVAFVVVSFVNNAVQKGFLPLLPAATTARGFSPADFLYSFVPSFIGMVLFLLWQPIDVYFRALQPFASLARPGGSSAEQSLLLDYGSCLPIEITIKALVNGHFKVAWVSSIGLLSLMLPILAGGVFTAQFVPGAQNVYVAASMPGYEALVVFIIIYVCSFMIIWPTKRRHLPHDISTLGQLVSFMYQSPLIAEPTFKDPKSKIGLVTRLMSTPVGETEKPRYAFGVYLGRDGKEHLGIDRYERPEPDGTPVTLR